MNLLPYVMPKKKERMEKLGDELRRSLPAIISLKPQKVIVFGSMSQENVRSSSDIDLLIIWDTDLPFMQRLQVFYDAIKPAVAMDILVYTPAELLYMQEVNPFIRRVLKEGKTVYET